jgi:molecular chaperone DnaK (HSP70)
VFYQGFHSYFKEEYVVNQIESLPFESLKFHYIFHLDFNGILTVLADTDIPWIPNMPVTAISKRISKLTMERIKTNISVYLATEKDNKRKSSTILQIEENIFTCENQLATNEVALKPDKVEKLREICTHYLLWLHNHYHNRADQDLETRIKDLQARLFEIFMKQKKEQFRYERIKLEQCIEQCKKRLPTTRKVSEPQRKVLTDLCKKHTEWLKNDPDDVAACSIRRKNLQCRIRKY